MPQVPTLQNQVRAEAAPNAFRRPLQNTGLQEIGQGLQQTGDVLSHIQREETLKAERAQLMDASRVTDTTSNDLVAQAQSKQLKDAIGITPALLGEFDKSTTQIAEGLKGGDRLKLTYREQVNNRRSQLQRQLEGHENQQRTAYEAKSREDFKDQAHVNAVTNYRDPQAIGHAIAEMTSAVMQTPGLDDGMRVDEIGIRRSGIHAGVVGRYLANDDIRGAENYYKGVKGNVNGDKAAWIENSINDAKRIADTRARALADHREAIADRTLNEIDRQIASGVPATPEMWASWQTKVKGTPAAAEYQNRVDDEQEVQNVLRKPIAEQVGFVQAQQQKLDTEGGNLRQAANLQRLKGAVQKNVTQLQTDPLLFHAARVAQDVAPLDLTQIGGDKSGALGAQLSDRAATISAMRKQYGPQVPQKLLLPQEAAQLGSVIGQSSSTRAASLFGSLRNAIGDDALYASTIQQLAPDNPVKAFAGLLAARERTSTLATHWFSPNETVDSQKVASTILDGQDILSPPKGDKASDGKPSLKLLLPDERPLQDAFASQVGTAFSDRPDAAQTAYQAVKAYYVGKAAQDGRLATDNQDVDSRIVREAVRGVLGNVVDVNGRGEVLAPWGMEASDFTTSARAAFTKLNDQIRWPGAPLPFDRLGLKAAGANTYYVTAGRGFLQDKSGNPVTLRVGQ